jgi:DNA-binding response OmpR family regulator
MRILVVEDEKKVASFIGRALTEEGHSVDVMYTGTEGLDAAISREYDALVLDHLLPGVSGRDVVKALRERGDNTPILMVTARTAVSERVAGLDAGADDYLTKPFSIDELLARVRALGRRRDTVVPTLLTCGDLAMNLATREVTRGGKPVELSAREYGLLEYMMYNIGRPLSRSMISEHVWGYDFDSASNVVDVYIRYLRNKIDQGFERKLISTVRNVGYRFG